MEEVVVDPVLLRICVLTAGYEVGASDGQSAGKLHADASGNPALVLVLIQVCPAGHLKLRSDGRRRTSLIYHSSGPHRYGMPAVDNPREMTRGGVFLSYVDLQAKLESASFENSSTAARGCSKTPRSRP